MQKIKIQVGQINKHFTESRKLTELSLIKLRQPIIQAADLISETFKNGNKLLICGNGGSAAESQHFSAELVGRYLKERRGLPAIALTVDTSSLTAIGNDYGYQTVFSRQVEAYAQPGDTLVCISTTGTAPNVISASKKAKSLKVRTISLTGCGGGILKSLCDINVIVPSKSIPHIQEIHLIIIHTICDLIEPYIVSPRWLSDL